MQTLADAALKTLTKVSALWLLINVRCKLVKAVIVANDEVTAEVAAGETGEGI